MSARSASAHGSPGPSAARARAGPRRGRRRRRDARACELDREAAGAAAGVEHRAAGAATRRSRPPRASRAAEARLVLVEVHLRAPLRPLRRHLVCVHCDLTSSSDERADAVEVCVVMVVERVEQDRVEPGGSAALDVHRHRVADVRDPAALDVGEVLAARSRRSRGSGFETPTTWLSMITRMLQPCPSPTWQTPLRRQHLLDLPARVRDDTDRHLAAPAARAAPPCSRGSAIATAARSASGRGRAPRRPDPPAAHRPTRRTRGRTRPRTPRRIRRRSSRPSPK